MSSEAPSASTAFPKDKEVLTIAVTGAGGRIGYSLLPLLASGAVFGPKQKVRLQLLEVEPAMDSLRGVVMELQDSAFPLLSSVRATSRMRYAFRGADVVILIGSVPRPAKLTERKQLLPGNVTIFRNQGKSLAKHAPAHARVLVVTNPTHSLTSVLIKAAAGRIPARNFGALTRLDVARAEHLLIERMRLRYPGVPLTVGDIYGAVSWGNHSRSQVPDFTQAYVQIGADRVSVREAIDDDAWLDGELVQEVRFRALSVLAAERHSSALSVSQAVAFTLRSWLCGTEEQQLLSMGVWTDGNPFGLPEGIVFSVPLKADGSGDWQFAPAELDDRLGGLVDISSKEVVEEQATATELLAKVEAEAEEAEADEPPRSEDDDETDLDALKAAAEFEKEYLRRALETL
eukprot:PLAT15625.1.p1 GENE.PLAT15625.1~~PLAT15625.1.p1  ORF type:complete len:426 (+),score=198.45 PLAT15625.1:74-1279(+)